MFADSTTASSRSAQGASLVVAAGILQTVLLVQFGDTPSTLVQVQMAIMGATVMLAVFGGAVSNARTRVSDRRAAPHLA